VILYRIREWGQAEWTDLVIDGELEEEVHFIVGAALDSSPYHVQKKNDEGSWEDLNS
jgi:hypothetical protein